MWLLGIGCTGRRWRERNAVEIDPCRWRTRPSPAASAPRPHRAAARSGGGAGRPRPGCSAWRRCWLRRRGRGLRQRRGQVPAQRQPQASAARRTLRGRGHRRPGLVALEAVAATGRTRQRQVRHGRSRRPRCHHTVARGGQKFSSRFGMTSTPWCVLSVIRLRSTRKPLPPPRMTPLPRRPTRCRTPGTFRLWSTRLCCRRCRRSGTAAAVRCRGCSARCLRRWRATDRTICRGFRWRWCPSSPARCTRPRRGRSPRRTDGTGRCRSPRPPTPRHSCARTARRRSRRRRCRRPCCCTP